MKQDAKAQIEKPDSAAVLGAALSLWQACKEQEANEPKVNLSEGYNGMDQFMREVMRVANRFERWACSHINFSEFSDVWPYLLEDKFGRACLSVIGPTELAEFDSPDCLRTALRLRLPIKYDNKLPVPVDVIANNPIKESAFQKFRIQTVRTSIKGKDVCTYMVDDDPYDKEFGPLYFGLYGVTRDGLSEHIADRSTYAETVSLVRNLVSGIYFPETPTSA